MPGFIDRFDVDEPEILLIFSELFEGGLAFVDVIGVVVSSCSFYLGLI